jgi:hypothetical protein
MTRAANGVPAKLERGNSRSVAAQNTAHRVRAMLDDVLNELEAEGTRGGRDWRKKLVDDFFASEAPLQWLQEFRLAAGVKDIEPSAGLGNMAGAALAGIFAGAAAQAASQEAAQPTAPETNNNTGLPIIDVTATPVPADDGRPQATEDDEEW